MSADYSFVIESAAKEAEGHIRLSLSAAPADFSAAHTAPGQYALMKVFAGDEKPRPLAFASMPKSAPEFIFRTHDEAAALALAGETRAVSAPTGAGFALPEGNGEDLWLIATGSAIGPVWTQLQTALGQRSQWGDIHVLYGALSPAHVCYQAEWAAAAAQNVNVKLCLTDVTSGDDQFRSGRVQSHLPASYRKGSRIVVCGHWEMMNDIVGHATERGVPETNIHKNY